jgi:hypothetical protein
LELEARDRAPQAVPPATEKWKRYIARSQEL